MRQRHYVKGSVGNEATLVWPWQVLGNREMLACIVCSKHGLGDGREDDAPRAEPTNPNPNTNTKEAVKSLSSQVKDSLKFSGSYRQGSSSFRRSKSSLRRHYLNDDPITDANKDHYVHMHRPRNSSSTPAWDFTRTNDDSMCRAKWMAATEDVVLEDNSLPKEWVAQVEPGVHINFVALPGGAGNDLKRIRFSRDMFNKWQAQKWWGENYDRIMELYNVQWFNRQALSSTPPFSDDGGERESFCSRMAATRESPAGHPIDRYTYWQQPPPPPPISSGKTVYYPSIPSMHHPDEHLLQRHLHSSFIAASTAGVSGVKAENASLDASRTTTSSREEASISISNASDVEVTEWVEEDEPGVYITIRELPDGTRDLRRVRFSRERFGEVHAKLWWQENRERIHAQYL